MPSPSDERRCRYSNALFERVCLIEEDHELSIQELMSCGKEFTIDRCKTEVEFRFGCRVGFGRNRVFVIVRNCELKYETKHRPREDSPACLRTQKAKLGP